MLENTKVLWGMLQVGSSTNVRAQEIARSYCIGSSAKKLLSVTEINCLIKLHIHLILEKRSAFYIKRTLNEALKEIVESIIMRNDYIRSFRI